MARIEGWWPEVVAKGNKLRHVPVPPAVIARLRAYLAACGHPADPGANWVSGGVALLGHAAYLGASPTRAVRRGWRRPARTGHAHARTPVVANQVPLPAAQALLGHASVQTTAAYAKTDLGQLRYFVEQTFTDPTPPPDQ
ncbi:hypothetical protein P3W85_33785 [Cupriavidus basilensis]|uniref:Tyrosine-type recombinase/integrase n=1 Tax=Cupriavidus basilensis TaxID=68895 RepID=A0ABT6AZ25_9BURK|nr:hypothetical protein [Cupriavidus basilensis]MDF3837869.1 hypothetical protein [Cupriavidus basilensis]